MKTLLLGMGNPILSDDAIGVRLARDLAAQLCGEEGLDIVEECSVGGLELLRFLEGCDRAIVLDSIQTKGGVPGDWYHFDAEALRETIHLRNAHDVNFATALELGRRLGISLPREIHILAVEIEENRTFSERMSPALEKAYPEISRAILEEVRAILGLGEPRTERESDSAAVSRASRVLR